MSSVTTTVTEFYRYVVGVDTHAATHSFAIVAAPNGVLVDQATFPTTTAGLGRARDWIGRRTGGDLGDVLVAAEGTGSYGAVLGTCSRRPVTESSRHQRPDANVVGARRRETEGSV